MKTIRIIGLVFILIVWIIFFKEFKNYEKDKKHAAEEFKTEFPNLDRNRNSKVRGIILEKKLMTDMYVKGVVCITLTNGQKFSIGGSTGNNAYNQSNIMDFLQVGDSISKKENDDIIVIYRDTVKYYFVLGQIIKTK